VKRIILILLTLPALASAASICWNKGSIQDKNITSAYAIAKHTLNKKETKLLKEAQRAWLKYIDLHVLLMNEDCNLYDKMIAHRTRQLNNLVSEGDTSSKARRLEEAYKKYSR
jgi:uncharacterized protein YecT (DUF1311 family)